MGGMQLVMMSDEKQRTERDETAYILLSSNNDCLKVAHVGAREQSTQSLPLVICPQRVQGRESSVVSGRFVNVIRRPYS